ncbi:MAG TPA: sugar transferase [Sedimentisphaerales bacterium]|nr:sugar transferase [Sedimentisphaerales bacterium]
MEQGTQVAEAGGKSETTTALVDREAYPDEDRLELLFSEFDIAADEPYSSDRLLPYPAVSESEISNFNEWSIRVLDVVASVAILLLAAPVMAVITLLLKISSRGPVLYKQTRLGKHGKVFTLYKFRTMVDNAEAESGPVLATIDDPRVTPVGRVLRRTRLDELPQLFCVLQGHMSLVGPRPERPYFVSRHKSLQGIRLAVKPGLTGLAQIRSYYDLKPEHKIKYDSLYIQKRSALLNLYILLKTVPVIFTNKGW